MSGELELTRTLTIGGPRYTTEVTVQEVATDDDSAAAVWLAQDPEGGDDQTERDVVALTWSEWAEIAGHVDICRGMMPDGSQNLPSYCGSTSNRGYLCIVDRHQRHASHIDVEGKVWENNNPATGPHEPF